MELKSTGGALFIEAVDLSTDESRHEVPGDDTNNKNQRNNRRVVKKLLKLSNYVYKKLSGQCPGYRIFVNNGD